MTVFVTGDTHSILDIDKLPRFFDGKESLYTKDDYLIICGDVQACGFSSVNEAQTREILSGLPVTVLFVDGNHENFDELDDLPVEKWHGGKVHFVEDDIIHLMRGQVYEIDNMKFFSFGGACTIDRAMRTRGISWFPQEIPTEEEYEEGWRNLEKNDYSVDYIISHTGPEDVTSALCYGSEYDEEMELRRYLQQVADNTSFTAWYFGHFHIDENLDDTFYCIYDDIVEL